MGMRAVMVFCGGALLVAACQSDAPPVESASAAPSPSAPPAASMVLSTKPGLEYSKRTLVRSNFAEAPKELTVEASDVPSEPTRILHRASAERLFGNSGLTLQWIGWEERGKVWVAVDDQGIWWLTGEQRGDGNSGLKLEGRVSEIGEDYFLFKGEITIVGAPGAGRFCDANKQWRFGITQGRKYWRLREFEWCDSLTDYVDIYF